MNDMRKQFLRGYIFSLLTEGELAHLSFPEKLLKAGRIFMADVPEVLTELTEEAAKQAGEKLDAAGRKIASTVAGMGADFIANVRRRGWRAVYKDIMAQYERGMDANARRK